MAKKNSNKVETQARPVGMATAAYLAAKNRTDDPKPEAQTHADSNVEALLKFDESALMEALKVKRQAQREKLSAELAELHTQMADLTAQLRALDLADGIVHRRVGGGGSAPKGAVASAIVEALKGGDKTPAQLLPLVEGLISGNNKRSIVAQNIARLKDAGQIEPTGERGVWRLVEAASESEQTGSEAAAETAA